uniref:Transcription initiation factor IIB family protein n=1 Tax=Caldiarchaeum subterraneum TaxID=311458 RepID=A0A7C5LDN4_CALS0
MLFDGKEGVGPRLTQLLHDRGIGTIKTGRLSPSEEKLLTRLLSEVAWISDKLALTKLVAEKAGELSRKAVAQKVFKRARRASAAAAVFIASNHCGLVKTLEEVALASDVPVNMLSHEVSRMVFGLNIKVKPPDYEALITRIGKNLGLEPSTVEEAVKLCNDLCLGRLLMGRKPSAVSAAALYIACTNNGLKIPFTRLASAAGVSALTLRKTIQHIQRHKL